MSSVGTFWSKKSTTPSGIDEGLCVLIISDLKLRKEGK